METFSSSRSLRVFLTLLVFCLLLLLCPRGIFAAGENSQNPVGLNAYNYVIGTQTFGPAYQFTNQQPLLETARAIQALGSTVIKFGLIDSYYVNDKPWKKGNVTARNPNIHTLTELARDEPTHRAVLDMPFATFILWAHTFANGSAWRDNWNAEREKSEYHEMYELTRYLLTHYNNSGKTFYLGHWEGDGWLRRDAHGENDKIVTPERVQRMVDWLNCRQRAIDDAKRDTPHQNVQVWHYTEVNDVRMAMLDGKKCLVNEVLPHTHVDFVSYSSYDTASDPALLTRALNYIESNLPPKPEIAGKRVFIGEFGFPAIAFSPEQQDHKTRDVLRVALEWGCPYALYWEIYNNEIDKRGELGYWMINHKGEKTAVYKTYQRFYVRARQYVSEYQQAHGRVPTLEEFEHEAVGFLQ